MAVPSTPGADEITPAQRRARLVSVLRRGGLMTLDVMMIRGCERTENQTDYARVYSILRADMIWLEKAGVVARCRRGLYALTERLK